MAKAKNNHSGTAYDSVKQNLPNTTFGGNKTGQGNYGSNKKPASVVSTSTTADRPVFVTRKNGG